MTELFLYPRLPASIARTRIAQITGKAPSALSPDASSSSPDAVYPATGGARFPAERMDRLRSELLDQARQLGFPSLDGAEAVRFDWVAAPILLERLSMHPGEACRNEVWSFITLQLLPDLATWRFPGQNDRRLLGGVRNAFQRLWWRAFLLRQPGEKDPWKLLRLPEDALVGLFERPGISSNAHVTRAIAGAIENIIENLPGPLREAGWRLTYKRIRQRIPLVNLDALEHQELISQLQGICAAATRQLKESKS
jgi:hypothetical protein